MSSYTIGIDLGTTGTKTVLFDTQAGIVASTSRTATLASPRPGWAEADPDQWYGNVVDSIRQLLADTGVRPSDIAAVSTSGMVPAVLALDAKGRPLRAAILQNDARAGEQIGALSEQIADIDLVQLTGSALTQQSVAPTAVWLQAQEPTVWASTASLVGSYDWVLQALGAERHVEENWALESGLFTIAGERVEEVLSAAGIHAGQLPPVLPPGAIAGALSAAAAEQTGLLPGTPLVVGGADHVLSAFAAGVERSGDWLVKLGGAGDVLVASDEIVVDPRLYLDAHPAPGQWLPNGCMATSGSLIRWYQALVGGTELASLDSEADARPAAEVLCLPYFLGEKSPLHDPDLRGAFVGMHLGHDRADLYRSVLEGIAFGFRHHADIFREIGLNLGRVSVTNGGSKSTLWKQIHAEVLGTEMYPVVDHPGASLGAAIIAGIGAGLLDWSDASAFVRLGDPVVPEPARIARYDDAYHQWRSLGEALTPTSHWLSRRSNP